MILRCRECRRDVSVEASRCPHCGTPRPTVASNVDTPYVRPKWNIDLRMHHVIAGLVAIVVVLSLLRGLHEPDHVADRPAAVTPVTVTPAPEGTAKAVALAAIQDAEHPCGTVSDAIRHQDGSIRAVVRTVKSIGCLR